MTVTTGGVLLNPHAVSKIVLMVIRLTVRNLCNKRTLRPGDLTREDYQQNRYRTTKEESSNGTTTIQKSLHAGGQIIVNVWFGDIPIRAIVQAEADCVRIGFC